MNKQTRQQGRISRHKRVRAKVQGTASCPRLCVFRGLKHVEAQIIDDEQNVTLVSYSSTKLKGKHKSKEDAGRMVGKEIGSAAVKKGVQRVVFDRGGYAYHGRVKALAQGAREAGLIF